MLKIVTVSFFGHREVENAFEIENQIEKLVRHLIMSQECIDFLVGRNGEFDQLVSSVIRRVKKRCRNDNSTHILVLSYPTAEYLNNEASFLEYYDEVEICEESANAFFKSAIQIRNRAMIDRSDLVVCCIEHDYGGAYQSIEYAKKQDKLIINVAEMKDTE